MVSIIIINYNTPDLVYDCMQSLHANVTVPYEVIVVDNGSKDKVDPVRISHPAVRLLDLPENKGFGGGNNAGAALARGDVLWLLNSDTLLPDKQINGLFSYFNGHPEIGILAPVLYHDRAQTDRQADFYTSFQSFRTLLTRAVRPPFQSDQEFFPVDIVVGASMIIRKKLYDDLGGFDERFFMFLEDDDLCLRVAKAGYKVGIYTRASIVHLKNKSIKSEARRKRLYYRSQALFWKKHHGLLATLVMKTLRAPYRLWKGL